MRKRFAGVRGRALAVGIAVIAAASGLAATAAVRARTADDPPGARLSLSRSLTAFGIGNISAARNHALAAVKAEPNLGVAHALLARTYLALGDGLAAQAELDRARATGFDGGRLHQLYAHAFLLQGDADRALAEAGKAQPRYAGYALRVGARALAAQGDQPGAQRALASLLAKAPGDSAAWSDLGRIRYDGGDVAGAIDAATRATALDAANMEASTLRAELVRAQYGLTAALPWFEATLRRDAYYHPALIEYASTLGDAGRYGDMLNATRRALATRPDSAQAFYLQAVLAARAGNYDLARDLIQRTGDRLDGLPGALLLGGTLDYQGGAYELAIAKWRQLVAQQPMNITARRLLGSALLRSGDAQGALDILRPVALRADADSYTLALVARAFERTGQRDWAAKFFDRAAYPGSAPSVTFGADDAVAVLDTLTTDDPADPSLRVGYIRGLVDTGKAPQALVQAQALVRMAPGAPAAQLALGDTFAAMGRYADAAASYRRAADIRFDEPTMLRTVDALDRAGQRADAANVLALFLSQNPQSIAGQCLAAHWQVAAGNFADAIETLEGLRSRVGNRDAALLSELAYAYIGDDDADTGLRYAKAAYALAPLNPATADAFGWALYQQGDTAAAVQLLEKAVAIAPAHAALRWHLAQAYTDIGRAPEAKTNIAAAMADPGFTDRAAALAVLKTLG